MLHKYLLIILVKYLLILPTTRFLISTALTDACTVVVHECVKLHVPLFCHRFALEHFLYPRLEAAPDLVEVTGGLRGRRALRSGRRHFV